MMQGLTRKKRFLPYINYKTRRRNIFQFVGLFKYALLAKDDEPLANKVNLTNQNVKAVNAHWALINDLLRKLAKFFFRFIRIRRVSWQ